MNPKIVAAWALVGIPLAYGVIETLRPPAQRVTG